MQSVGGLPEREERKAYVRFKRVPVEDKQASLKAGHYVAKDVEYVMITPPYTKEVVEKKVDAWIAQLEIDVQNHRYPKEWLEDNRKQVAAFRAGQELPLIGEPIRGWSVISPATQENLIRMSILTVEDLAGVNDEGARRIGMGSLDLKTKAKAWLAQRNDKGPLTIKIAAVEAENEHLKASLASMKVQMDEMSRLIANIPTQSVASALPAPKRAIGLNDILPDGEPEDPDTSE